MEEERETYRGEPTQGDSPVWEPLLAAIGDELAGDFMWMFEVRLTDGRLIQAYKNIDTSTARGDTRMCVYGDVYAHQH